jgi:lysophospholipase L1-like esterase
MLTPTNSGLLPFVVSGIGLFLSAPLFAGNDKNFTYLALGDSVAFGLNPTLLVPNQPPPAPSVFVGYPEIVAQVEHLLKPRKEVNAACPGETSSSFITSGVPDYGCNSPGPQGQPPFKTFFGLHTTYPDTQLNFAVSELSTNKHINLVTLGIGSNDVLLLIGNCSKDPNPTGCVNAGIPDVLQTFEHNLGKILTAIRTEARYEGTLVLVEYYSPSADLNAIAQALNAMMVVVGMQFGALFADGFTAFELAASPYGGDVCKAGLLIRLSPTTCDIHPSPSGRDLLAATVLASITGLP